MASLASTLAGKMRLVQFFYVQRVKGFPPPGDEPFMDPGGIEKFKELLSGATRYLEFGSGGTTVLADRMAIPSISVENDRFYANAVASTLRSGTVRQIIVDTGLTREWGFILFPNHQKARAYVNAPFAEEAFPDFILVDGRFRVACALETARQANLRGCHAAVMVDDYEARPHFRKLETFLGAPERAGRTAIFTVGKRPVSASAVDEALKDQR